MPKKVDKIEIRSEEVSEVLSRPPSWLIRWGNLLIFIIIMSLLFLSWKMKYPDFIHAKILITTKVPLEKIEPKIGGRITSLFVKNYQQVSKGQILALIENSANFRDVLELKKKLEENPVDISKEFKFPLEKILNFSLGEIQRPYIDFEKAYTAYKIYKKLTPHVFELNSIKNSYLENQKMLKAAKEQLEFKNKTLQHSKRHLERSEILFKEGVLSISELEEKKVNYLSEKYNHKAAHTEIIKINENLNKLRQNLKKEEINKEKEDVFYLKEVARAYDNLKNMLYEWEMKYLLRSSIDGLVSFQKYWGENQFVKPSEIIMSILPKNNLQPFGKLTLPAKNTGKIKKGQDVFIKLDNYPYQEFGQLRGTIKLLSISTDDKGDYHIEVKLPEKLITTYNKKILFNQEMTGSAEIITEEMRFIERIFHKFRKIFRYNEIN